MSNRNADSLSLVALFVPSSDCDGTVFSYQVKNPSSLSTNFSSYTSSYIMHSNIERAVADIITANKAVTVANIFPIYIRVAGFDTVCDEAVIAFEHALDKHPLPSAEAPVQYANAISKLTSEYWCQKLGVTGAACQDKQCVFCRNCGRISVVDGQQVVKAQIYRKEKRARKYATLCGLSGAHRAPSTSENEENEASQSCT